MNKIYEEFKKLKVYVCHHCGTIFKMGYGLRDDFTIKHACSKDCVGYLKDGNTQFELFEIQNKEFFFEFILLNEVIKMKEHPYFCNDVEVNYSSDYVCSNIPFIHLPQFDIYDAKQLTNSEKESLINRVDFRLNTLYPTRMGSNITEFFDESIIDEVKDKRVVYKVVDIQGGNLSDIESEVFFSIDDVLDRLEVYFESLDIFIFNLKDA